jgi:hypothetical protein
MQPVALEVRNAHHIKASERWPLPLDERRSVAVCQRLKFIMSTMLKTHGNSGETVPSFHIFARVRPDIAEPTP